MYQRYGKRVWDIALSMVLLIITSWLMLLCAVGIRFTTKGPVIFKQERLGRNGKVFTMLKFRSMKVGSEHTGTGVYSGKNDQRVTKIGKWLRATSLDELPQLFNILKGDMSFIGPRPPLTYHPWKFEQYTEQQKRMFEVRPGLTGWAQIHGRRMVEWHERIRLNIWYIDHISFLLDAKIFFLTIGKVFVSADNANTEKTVVGIEKNNELLNKGM